MFKKSRHSSHIEPRYYKGGLAITEYIHKDVWDEIRAFVVMRFPYRDNIVEQAFYRSSGHNSAESFGKEFVDAYGEHSTDLARGTWLPFNAIVVKVDTEKVADQDEDLTTSMMPFGKKNIMFILKMPFYEPGNGIFSRFHNDPELAMISYLMGGGIWNTEMGKVFSRILV